MSTIIDAARGYYSGYATVAGFHRTQGRESGRAYLSCAWGGFKTALKADRVASFLTKTPRTSNPTIWLVFTGWLLAYGTSAIVCETPNKILRNSPHILLITRVALTALEFLVSAQKAAISFAAMGVTQLCYMGYFDPTTTEILTKYVPIAAKVTVFAFGDPLTKVIMTAEFVAYQILSVS